MKSVRKSRRSAFLPTDGTSGLPRRRPRDSWQRLRFYLPYLWRFLVLRQPAPLIYGIALTDRCNLHCRGCRVAHTGRTDLSRDQLVAALQDAWKRGFRELYFSGGEPTLWRDGAYTLNDAIAEARRIGLAVRHDQSLELTEEGAFWLHLLQNYFALNYVNILWTRARREPWPRAVAI